MVLLRTPGWGDFSSHLGDFSMQVLNPPKHPTFLSKINKESLEKLEKQMGENWGPTPLSQKDNILGGGFNYFLFSPRKLGKISNLTSIFFRWVVQPPTRHRDAVSMLTNIEAIERFSAFFFSRVSREYSLENEHVP